MPSPIIYLLIKFSRQILERGSGTGKVHLSRSLVQLTTSRIDRKTYCFLHQSCNTHLFMPNFWTAKFLWPRITSAVPGNKAVALLLTDPVDPGPAFTSQAKLFSDCCMTRGFLCWLLFYAPPNICNVRTVQWAGETYVISKTWVDSVTWQEHLTNKYRK